MNEVQDQPLLQVAISGDLRTVTFAFPDCGTGLLTMDAAMLDNYIAIFTDVRRELLPTPANDTHGFHRRSPEPSRTESNCAFISWR